MCTLHNNIQIKQRVSISSWVFFLKQTDKVQSKTLKTKKIHTHIHICIIIYLETMP